MVDPDRSTLLHMYETVATMVAADDRLRSLITSGQAMVMYYSPRGQEIIPAAVSVCLRPDDYAVTTYRGLHDQIAKGVPLVELFGEYLGRVAGSCKGKGGGMHVTYPAAGLMVTTGVVGSGLPLANGLALASALRGDGRVTVVYFGDGAANIGAFHETLNLASLWRLPIVFCCQNNRYGEHTAFANSTSVDHVADRAAAYRIPGVTVDGNDPVAMWRAAGAAVDRARAGDGPTLVEAVTYRLFGHYFGEEPDYMPAEERAAALAADPVSRFRASLIDQGHASEEDLAGVDKRAEAQVEEAMSVALNSPFADPGEIRQDVYAEELV